MSNEQKAKRIARHAFRYEIADAVLRTAAEKDPDGGTSYAFPGMTLSAFAAELYLKALIRLEGSDPPKKHNLAELFDLLSPETQHALEREWSSETHQERLQEAARAHNAVVPEGLRAALLECGDAFVAIRYIFDGGDARFYLTFLPKMARTVIMEKTGWWPELVGK